MFTDQIVRTAIVGLKLTRSAGEFLGLAAKGFKEEQPAINNATTTTSLECLIIFSSSPQT
jgi:hypothetical protein